MKKILGLLFLAISLIACETEPLDPSLNPNGPPAGGGSTTASIVGDWLYTDVQTTITSTTTIMGNSTSVTSTLEYVSSNAILSFNSDGTYAISGNLTIEVFLEGASQGTQDVSIDDRGTYTVTGDDLDLVTSVPGGTSAFPADAEVTIDTLNTTSLVISSTATIVQTSAGATTESLNEGTATFVRQ